MNRNSKQIQVLLVLLVHITGSEMSQGQGKYFTNHEHKVFKTRSVSPPVLNNDNTSFERV